MRVLFDFFRFFRAVSGLLLLNGMSQHGQQAPNRRVSTSSTIWRSDGLDSELFFGVFAPKIASRQGFRAVALERKIIFPSQKL